MSPPFCSTSEIFIAIFWRCRYVEHGYSGHVPGFITGLENGHATVYMLEPKVARVTIKYEDPQTGQPLKGRPWIDPAVIRKELPFKVAQLHLGPMLNSVSF